LIACRQKAKAGLAFAAWHDLAAIDWPDRADIYTGPGGGWNMLCTLMPDGAEHGIFKKVIR